MSLVAVRIEKPSSREFVSMKASEDVAKRISIPAFILTEVCDREATGAVSRTVKVDGQSARYCFRAQTNNGTPSLRTNRLCLVVCGDGAMWREASLYLVAKLEDSAGKASAQSIIGIADDLADFRRFLELDRVDFRQFPKSKFARPTYRYHGSLMTKLRLGEIAVTTGKRRILSVLAFYRWLEARELLRPSNKMWEERRIQISFPGFSGRTHRVSAESSDLAISSPKQADPFSSSLMDGAMLRPLPIEEQLCLLQCLKKLGNSEMTLAHLIAMFTGARAQTFLTLKAHYFLDSHNDDSRFEIPIPCGLGTGNDTKNDKRLNLFAPRWLYKKIHTYCHSARASARRGKSIHDINDRDYLLLTNRGSPYYLDKEDLSKFDQEKVTKYFPNGAAIRVFIGSKVLPAMREVMGQSFHYSCHDLRATYGMNLTDIQLKLVEDGQITLHEAREFVRVRMGHESSKTTDRYLNFRKFSSLGAEAQDRYEVHLAELVAEANSTLSQVQENG